MMIENRIRRIRQKSGSTLVVIVLTFCFILVPVLFMINQFGLYSIDQARVQYIVDAAGLLAANDLSRIVINDPHFGYVSLSNHPPIGAATRAPDGEPLPVTGVNTWIGTVRQNTIVAKHLQSDAMMALADNDRACLQATQRSLNTMIQQEVAGSGAFIDCQGQAVNLLSDVTEFLQANLPGNLQVVSVQLTNGWLERGGTTSIRVPQPQTQSFVSPEDFQTGTYRAFVDLPVGNRSFMFAGAGATSAIATTAQFRPADDSHICSIVKIDCTVKLKNPLNMPFKGGALRELRCISCCQPYSSPDAGPGGAMTVKFSGQPVSGLQSWSDFLKPGNFQDRQVLSYDVVGGDYLSDKNSRVRRSKPKVQEGAAQQFGEHLYYWLRNEHVRPRIDSILAMVDEPFEYSPNAMYAYVVSEDGKVQRRRMNSEPFDVGIVSESQIASMVDTRVQNGVAPVIIFRDNVQNLSTTEGGKHCGQPLGAEQANWEDLAEYGGTGSKSHNLLLAVFNQSESSLVSTPPVNTSTNSFISLNPKDLSGQTRKSTYGGGLAVAIDIGGIKPSTASRDVASMRALKR